MTAAEAPPPGRPAARTAVLFVCAHGSARSPMAAALLRHLAGDSVRVTSAGPEPDPEMNPVAMAALTRAGVATPDGDPVALTEALALEADLIVLINRPDPLPLDIPQELWQVSRRPVGTAEAAREVRDELAARVRVLAADLRSGRRDVAR